jgi:hypothetical protein
VQEYQKKQKEHEELLKWTGNMTSLDLIEIYNGDPSQYFYDKVSSPYFSLQAFTGHPFGFQLHFIGKIGLQSFVSD